MIELIKPHLTAADVFTDSDFRLNVLRRSPQIPFPKHTHDFSELVIVYGGSGTHFTEDEEYVIGSGDVFIVTGARAHGYRNPEELQLINIIFDRQILQRPAFNGFDLDAISGYHALFTWEPRLRTEHCFESRLRLNPLDLGTALNYAEKIENELFSANPGFRAMTYSFFIQLCGFLSRRYEAGTNPGMKELSRISGVLNFLEKNSDRFISITELLDFAGMSESTMLRLFRKITGVSPIEYHSRLRIERICYLLSATDKTITEIAFELGFSDSNYLSRMFKKMKGIPPGEWRKSI